MFSIDLTAVLLGSIALACQLGGLLVPGWWVVGEPGENRTVHYGIWTTIVCEQGSCEERETDASGRNAWIQVTKVFEVVAAVLVAVAVTLYAVGLFKASGAHVLNRLFVCLMAIAGTSIVIGIAVFAKKSAGLARYPKRETSGGKVDWPIGLSAAAAILCFLDALAVGLFLRTSKSLSESNLFDS
ncbi:uncharacterized protein LOC121381913 [Gigantopelta aegis]|uniref:uncharacterized protein LOC121381913 n=1 Tax=Gigantopelta aegis TaxID=1735272 RepID=UPI001B887B26|nr:uncharacterized protein LOC121381913 [Gigantopelta aegis]